MRIKILATMCFSALVLTGCLSPEERAFFAEFPKSDTPIYVNDRPVYLPLYDEHVEQLHLFGMGQCEAIQPLVQVPGSLFPIPEVEGACLFILSHSKVVSSDAGNYDEFSVIIPILRFNDAGEPRPSTYMHKMYLNPGAQFSIDLGIQIWGYPKEAGKRVTFRTKGPFKKVKVITQNNDKLIMKWKKRGEVDKTVSRTVVDLVTPTGGVAETVLRIFKNNDQVAYDPELDNLVFEGEFLNLMNEVGFIPLYWQNAESNVVSGI